ncbi:aldose epimerase family protein [Olivibacter sitiensis]|uniref:aldose epimerase family protein n=1 Tax=Olivibacter sitiensis TaxID=376470 RepID=UPI0003FEEF42|nr:aldose epimerase family protein [Olivibacter sitiensis]
MKEPNLSDFKQRFGEKSSALIILKNSRGVVLSLCNYGARIVSLSVPDKDGKSTDVVLGFNHIQDYLQASERYFGVTVGRYANRIAKGSFRLGEREYRLDKNNGDNCLHGGREAFQDKIWDRQVNNPNRVAFYYVSSDMEGGFPGTLRVCVEFELTDSNEIIITYQARSNKDTVINLTNHAYFNLNGEGNGLVDEHIAYLAASRYLPVDEHQIPTGDILNVAGSAFDFLKEKALGKDWSSEEQVNRVGGYDHCFVLDERVNSAEQVAARVTSPDSGICLEVLTTEPGIQLYTGNSLDGKDVGKSGKAYVKHSAFCLETQHFPDSPHHAQFPSTFLPAGKEFVSKTIYRFSVIK